MDHTMTPKPGFHDGAFAARGRTYGATKLAKTAWLVRNQKQSTDTNPASSSNLSWNLSGAG
jgi:hypothetical protein